MTTMRMNRLFAQRWRAHRLDATLQHVSLMPRLRALVEAPFVRDAGGLYLEPLVSSAAGMEEQLDVTWREAFANKFYVDDFIDVAGLPASGVAAIMVQQGVKAGFALAERLQQEQGRHRVVLSFDATQPTLSSRFFGRRKGAPWGTDDPDDYALEAVLMIDT